MRKTFLLLLLAVVSLFPAMAQTGLSVSGTVSERDSGEPLVGVTVLVKGTERGTVTDLDGKFSIEGLQKGSTLLFSSVGMKPQSYVVQKSGAVGIVMETSVTNLDDLVVIGYGSSRKRDVTGAITSISGDDLKLAPTNNPVNALQGKVASLMVTNSGSAGASSSILLRGIGTIQSGTNPLFVVDGMLTDNIDFISPSNVLSIEVLKDPSSLSIFGVQGANGVIILTTKRASEGKLTVSYDGYGGVQYVGKNDRVKLTNADQFTELYNELLMNQSSEATPYNPWTPDLTGEGTDWVDLMLRPAAITSHSLTIANSTQKSSNVLSLNYFYQDGVLKYDNYDRYSLRYAGDYNLSKHIRAGSNMTLGKWSKDGQTANIVNAVRALPTYSPYAPEEEWDPENPGSYYNPSPSVQKDVGNPVATMEINKDTGKSYGYRGIGNAYLEFDFLKDFTFKATGYIDLGLSESEQFSPKYDINNATSNSSQKRETNSFSRSTAEYKKYQADLLLNYKKLVGKHNVSAMVGYTAYLNESKGFSAGADTIGGKSMNVVPSDFWMLSQGHPNSKTNSDWYSAESFVSYLARVAYQYDQKYLLTATFRADGSSKFSPKHRWGYFPSIGLGWVITEESFMEDLSEQINFLKLKASWGRLGNDKIGNYLWLPSINPTGQTVVVGGETYYIPVLSYQVDENIHWEVMSGFDIGIDGVFLDNRLNAEIGWYTKTTRDLLAYVSPSVSVGNGYAITNAGSVRNTGVEIVLGWKDNIDDFHYGVSFNASTLKNKVLELGNRNADIISGNYHRTMVGETVGSFYGYVQEGIFQNDAEVASYDKETTWTNRPGDVRYADLDGDGKITDKDRKALGSPLPTFMYGFNVNFAYKGFDLSIDFNGVAGNKILNEKKLPTFSQFNYYETTLDRWHGEGTSNKEPILDNSRSHNFLPSDNLLENGSYFRIKSIQLGYTLPKSVLKKMKVQTLRFYVNAQNVYTFKKNTGFTPEIGGSILSGGVDSGSTYPIPATYTAGLSFNF